MEMLLVLSLTLLFNSVSIHCRPYIQKSTLKEETDQKGFPVNLETKLAAVEPHLHRSISTNKQNGYIQNSTGLSVTSISANRARKPRVDNKQEKYFIDNDRKTKAVEQTTKAGINQSQEFLYKQHKAAAPLKYVPASKKSIDIKKDLHVDKSNSSQQIPNMVLNVLTAIVAFICIALTVAIFKCCCWKKQPTDDDDDDDNVKDHIRQETDEASDVDNQSDISESQEEQTNEKLQEPEQEELLSIKDKIRAFESQPPKLIVNNTVEVAVKKPCFRYSETYEEELPSDILIMGQVLRKHGDASDKDQKQKGGKGSIKHSVDKNKNENIEDDFGLIQRESEILKSFRRPPAPRNRAKSSRISRKVLPTIESNDLEFISHEGKDTVHFTEQSTESKEVKKKQQTNLVPIVLTDKVKNKNNKKCSRSSSSSSDSSKSSIEDANDKEQSGGVDTGNEVVSLLTEDVGEDLSLKQGPCSHNDQTEDINQTSSSVEDNVDHQSDKDNKSDDDNEEKKEEKSEEEVSIEDNAEDLIELEVDKNTSSLVSEIMEEYNSKRMSHNTDEQSEKLSLSKNHQQQKVKMKQRTSKLIFIPKSRKYNGYEVEVLVY
ncbi:DNA ligase 1 isoform X1 [Octopus sinensis]|uniref:DNA ligase 1 isoform X1 n=1 Tax=Octopus sinensis TaxID=2607531 RepID=A0A7E6ERD1_9MOLL|nr:DNA ligase 1 isoform X1 [Octopus sinensis]